MNRAIRLGTLLLANAVLVITGAPAAHAGDDAAHRMAGENGLAKIMADREMVPLAPGSGANICPENFATVSAIGSKCPFVLDKVWGDVVRWPDSWPCWLTEPDTGPLHGPEYRTHNYRLLPPEMNRVQWELGGRLTRLSELSCNWTHFASNPLVTSGGKEINAAWAQQVTEEWADQILEHIESEKKQRYWYMEYCDAATFQTFTFRALQAVHFPHDAACKHHTLGNEVCSPSSSFGGWNRDCARWIHSTAKAALEQSGWSSTPGTTTYPPLRCDDELRYLGHVAYRFPFGFKYVYYPPYWATMYEPCMKGGLSIACSGYERTLRHHCELNWTGRDYTAGSTSEFYGECSPDNFSSSSGSYPKVGADIAAKLVKSHLDKWEKTCAPPTQPCEEKACWTWCERSTPIDWEAAAVDGSLPFGACTADTTASSCKLTTCTCAKSVGSKNFADVCGTIGKPACPAATERDKCEAGLVVDPRTNKCASCGAAGQTCCAGDKCTEGSCALAAGACVKTCGDPKPPKTCYSSVLEKNAYCPFTDMCQPACLCTSPDPYSSGCLGWLDEWSCKDRPVNPFGGCY